MLIVRMTLFLAVATLAVAVDTTLSASSTSSLPSTPSILPLLSTASTLRDLPLDAKPLCSCRFNEELQQNALVCAASEDEAEDQDVELGDILRFNCEYVLVEVSHLNLEFIDADAFSTKPQLKFVHLYSDHIEHIDREAFRVLTSLIEVDLSDNSLLSVDPGLFSDNSLLTSVSLADNPLIDLKPNAPILESASITSLDLSMCKLTSLSVESFSKLPNLRRLDLSSNNIQQLQVTALQTMPQLNALNIANNRWRCDCAFKEVVDFARLMEETDARVRCFGTDRVLESWSDLTAQKYCPDDEYDHSSSEEYDEDYAHDDTVPAIDEDNEEAGLLLISNDLQKDTDDLRQEMSALLDANTEVTPDDETPDVDDDVVEVILVTEDYNSDDGVDIFPAAVLVFVLSALIVFGIGVAIMVCRAAIKGDFRQQGFNKLHEDVEGEPVYVKVPLE